MTPGCVNSRVADDAQRFGGRCGRGMSAGRDEDFWRRTRVVWSRQSVRAVSPIVLGSSCLAPTARAASRASTTASPPPCAVLPFWDQARTGQVSVRLSLKADYVRLQVADDRTGFDPDTLQARRQCGGGFGLFAVQERADYPGGDVRIDTAPGARTVTTLVCPVSVRENVR